MYRACSGNNIKPVLASRADRTRQEQRDPSADVRLSRPLRGVPVLLAVGRAACYRPVTRHEEASPLGETRLPSVRARQFHFSSGFAVLTAAAAAAAATTRAFALSRRFGLVSNPAASLFLSQSVSNASC